MWSESDLATFIELYRNESVLYNCKDELYHNKSARRGALERLMKEMAKIRPGITEADVKAKWNSLRTQFTRELQSLKSIPSGSEVIIKPKLWCFEKLLFLQDFVKARKGVCNLTNTSSEEINNDLEFSMGEVETGENHYEMVEENNVVMEEVSQLEEFESESRYRTLVTKANPTASTSTTRIVTNIQANSTPSTSHTSTRMVHGSTRVFSNEADPQSPSNTNTRNASSSKEPLRKQKRQKGETPDQAEEVLQSIGDALNKINAAETQSSETEIFGSFIASELRLFKNINIQKQCKREICRMLINFQELDDEE